MSEILSSKNYGIFKPYPLNRPISRNLVEILKISIGKNNMLRFQPIVVNDKMQVMDGQHRLEACREIGETVWYVKNEKMTVQDMIDINTAKAGWTYDDYLILYCKEGYEEYLKLKKLMDKYKLGLKSFLHFTDNNKMNMTSNPRLVFNEGKYVLLPLEVIENTIDNFLSYKNLVKDICTYENKSFLNSQGFFRGICAVMNDPEVDQEEFRRKLAMLINRVRPCASVAMYRAMFQDIYNYKKKIPIDFRE